MNLVLHAVSMVCGLAAAVFAAEASGRWYRGAVLILGFGLTVAMLESGAIPDPAWTAGLAAVVACLQIFRPAMRIWTAAFGGILAGVLAAVLEFEGLTPAAALLVAVFIPVLSFGLATWRRNFASERLREDALLLVFMLGVIVAVVPEVLAGWQSAQTLTMEEAMQDSSVLSAWVILLSGSSMILGGIYSFWRHNR